MTNVTVLGNGNMARGIATRALAGGHSVQILGRSAQAAAGLAAELDGAASGAIGEDISGEIVVLAVPYQAALDLVGQLGDALTGRVVVDITNPLKETLTG